MKLKSLLLGSVAAAGLSTSAFAADLSTVVSSFDVCEDLGISGTLQLASTDDCLQISGEVKYEFKWGDYAGSQNLTNGLVFDQGRRTVMDNDGAAGSEMDWYSKVESWVQFVGSASSEFGTAKAVIKLYNKDETEVKNEAITNAGSTTVSIKEAYVSVGDGTSLVAGRRDTSVFKDDNDEPFGFIGLFHSDAVDKGVDVLKNHLPLKGHVIQLYHAVGDSGVVLSAGLENLNNGAAAVVGPTAPLVAVAALTGPQAAGTAVGTVAYKAPDGSLVGHISGAAGGVLDGTVEDWKVHAGFTGTFDSFKIRGAFAGGSSTVGGVTTTEWNGLLTGQATFDMFTLAAAFEAANFTQGATNINQWGASVTGSAAVTDTVTLEAGFRWYDSDTATANTEGWQAAVKAILKLTDTLTATLEGGYYDTATGIAATRASQVLYGSAELGWKPGGQFETSIKGEVNSIGAYKATFKASKKFD